MEPRLVIGQQRLCRHTPLEFVEASTFNLSITLLCLLLSLPFRPPLDCLFSLIFPPFVPSWIASALLRLISSAVWRTGASHIFTRRESPRRDHRNPSPCRRRRPSSLRRRRPLSMTRFVTLALRFFCWIWLLMLFLPQTFGMKNVRQTLRPLLPQ